MAASDFKLSQDMLEEQRREFTRGGIIKNLLGLVSAYPWLSLIFLLIFSLLANALYDISALAITTGFDDEFRVKLWLVVGYIVALGGMYLWLWLIYRGKFKDVPVTQRQALIVIMSGHRNNSGYTTTPAYTTYQSLLYTPAGQPAISGLRHVVLIASEDPDVLSSANDFAAHIRTSGRTAEVFQITIGGKSILNIQRQLEDLFGNLQKSYKPHDTLADYTGGTKEISIALLRASEKNLVLPIYLKSATTGNYSRYS